MTAYKRPAPSSLALIHPEKPLYAYDYANAWLSFPLGKLLDYGCGNGQFLTLVVGRADECWGVDINEEMAAIA